METREDAIKAFNQVDQKFLSQVQKVVIGKITKEFEDLATTIMADVPKSFDRTNALMNLLTAKFQCIQSITHTGYEEKKEHKDDSNKTQVLKAQKQN